MSSDRLGAPGDAMYHGFLCINFWPLRVRRALDEIRRGIGMVGSDGGASASD